MEAVTYDVQTMRDYQLFKEAQHILEKPKNIHVSKNRTRLKEVACLLQELRLSEPNVLNMFDDEIRTHLRRCTMHTFPNRDLHKIAQLAKALGDVIGYLNQACSTAPRNREHARLFCAALAQDLYFEVFERSHA